MVDALCFLLSNDSAAVASISHVLAAIYGCSQSELDFFVKRITLF